MRKIVNLATTALCLFALGCRERQATNKEAVVVKVDYTQAEQQLDLSTILEDDIEIIPLQTSGESIIGEIDDVRIVGDKVFVIDLKLPRVAVFDRSGKFIRTIGRRGRGPNEFAGITSVEVTNDYVAIYDRLKEQLFFYNIDGSFRSVKDVSNLWAMDIIAVGDKLYFVNAGSQTDKGCYRLFELSKDGDYLNSALPFSKKIADRVTWGLDRYSAKNGDELMFYQPPYDSLFVIKGLELEKLYYVDFGARKVPESVISLGGTETLSTIMRDNYISGVDHVQLTDKYLIVHFSEEDDFTAFFNRETGEVKVYSWLIDTRHPGLGYSLSTDIIRDEEWIGSISAQTLKFVVAKHHDYTDKDVVLTDFQKRMVSLADSLDETDNPVLFVQKFKR